MLITIEGCDGSGKTTLAQSLAEAIRKHEDKVGTERPVKIIHSGPPTRPILEEYEKAIQDFRPWLTHLIIDRWHWGERVYGPLYRGESKLSLSGLYHVDKFLDSLGGIMLLAHETPGVIRARLADRGEDFLQDKHIEEVIAGFDQVFEDSVMTEKHRVTSPGPVDVAAAVLLGYVREGYALELAKYPTYVGPRYPEYLLLGEQRKDPTWKSAFVPGNTTSGHFLLNALPKGIVRRSGLANACEEDVKGLYEDLQAPATVTLGVKAGKVASEAGIPHFNVPHPQYIRRFHNKKQSEYGEVIGRGLHGEEVTGWPR